MFQSTACLFVCFVCRTEPDDDDDDLSTLLLSKVGLLSKFFFEISMVETSESKDRNMEKRQRCQEKKKIVDDFEISESLEKQKPQLRN